AGALWSAFCCLAAFHMAGTWVPILLSATCGLGALAGIVYFAAFGRVTLVYALILTMPMALAIAIAENGEGPVAAQLFMCLVFVLLVLPMLAKLHKDHWDAVIGRAVADERAQKAETTALQAQRESADKSAFLAQVGHEI